MSGGGPSGGSEEGRDGLNTAQEGGVDTGVVEGGDDPVRDGAGLVADLLGGEVTAEGMEIVPMRPDTAVFDAIVRLTGTSGYARVCDVLADVVHVGVDKDHATVIIMEWERAGGVELLDGGNWVRARTVGLDGDPGGGVGDIGKMPGGSGHPR